MMPHTTMYVCPITIVSYFMPVMLSCLTSNFSLIVCNFYPTFRTLFALDYTQAIRILLCSEWHFGALLYFVLIILMKLFVNFGLTGFSNHPNMDPKPLMAGHVAHYDCPE
jgi:hypothetical protein